MDSDKTQSILGLDITDTEDGSACRFCMKQVPGFELGKHACLPMRAPSNLKCRCPTEIGDCVDCRKRRLLSILDLERGRNLASKYSETPLLGSFQTAFHILTIILALALVTIGSVINLNHQTPSFIRFFTLYVSLTSCVGIVWPLSYQGSANYDIILGLCQLSWLGASLWALVVAWQGDICARSPGVDCTTLDSFFFGVFIETLAMTIRLVL